MLSLGEIRQLAKDHGWPSEDDPEFWPKVAPLIDEGIEEHKDTLKDWWLVRQVPFWYPIFGGIELNYMIAVQKYYLDATREKRIRLLKGLQEPYLGHTAETYEVALHNFGYDGILTGTWPIKNAHHIMKWEQHSGRDISEYDHIIEIGAGLGDMPRYAYDIGYRGTYTILDLPPTCKIQQAYLRGQYPVKWVHEVTEITPQPNTLVIATWSLSEIDFDKRNAMCQHLQNVNWLIAFQADVMGRHNVAWFTKFFAHYTRSRVVYEMMPYHNYQGGSFYVYATPVSV